MKKRFLALFLCCVMVFTLLPAALTTAFATGEADGEQPACTCGATEDAAHAEDCPLYVNPEQQPDDEQPAPDEQQPVCTCGAAEGAAHTEDCPLYVNPEQPADEQQPEDEQQPVCTCGAAEGAAHAEDCPLYVNPEQQPEDEQPVVTKLVDSTALTALFERLMAAETMEAFEAIIEETPEEQLKALTEEQVAQVEAHADSLMPEPLPPIDVTPSEPPVQSEVYRPTVNYTNVAPFGAPVTGGHR